MDELKGWKWMKFYLLSVLFGYCGWMSVNSVWVELPLVVNTLPEGWGTPSYLALLVQVAVVGPILFSIAKRWMPGVACVQRPVRLIAVCIAVDAVTSFLLSFFWHQSVDVFGSTRSLPLFILFFIHALINCTSNVMYMPYMYNFHPSLTNAYFVGLGLSGLIPSLLSLGQGTGETICVFNNVTNSTQPLPPVARFSVQVFFLLTSQILTVGFISFLLLHRLPDSHIVKHVSASQVGVTTEETEEQKRQSGMTRKEFRLLLLVTSVVCSLVNGVLPSVQAYASLPYGQTIYQLVIVLSNLASPVSSYLSFIVTSSIRNTCLLGGLVVIGSVYLIILASQSPFGLLPHSAGPFLCVTTFVIVSGLSSYLRTVVADRIRRSNKESRMFLCGFFSQFGSFFGAVIMFPLVNIYRIFQSVPPCPS